MDPVVGYTISGAVRLLFLVSLLHKRDDFRGFVQAVDGYRIVPEVLSWPVAIAIACAEAWVMLAGDMVIGGGVLLLYASVIAVDLVRGIVRIDCGCGGVAGHNGLSWWLVCRNVLCAAAAIAATARPASRELVWMDGFSALAGVAAMAGLYVATDRLIANFTAMRRLQEAT
jgi:hypothetical protein